MKRSQKKSSQISSRSPQQRAKLQERRKAFYVEETARRKADGCLDCGETDPIVLTFDHRNPDEKSGNINRFRTVSTGTLLKELDKCDVVCANCHMKRSHARRQVSNVA